MQLSNKWYDILKRVSWLALPITTLIIAVINVLSTEGLTTSGVILGIMTAIQSFLGYILDESNRKYNLSNDEDMLKGEE